MTGGKGETGADGRKGEGTLLSPAATGQPTEPRMLRVAGEGSPRSLVHLMHTPLANGGQECPPSSRLGFPVFQWPPIASKLIMRI